jgi:DNA-binding response OmpR family regulator
MLEYSLSREGFMVRTAINGGQGLKIVQSGNPDLVLLDLMLPDVDGLEVCRRLKSDQKTQRIPVVMVTARGSESDIVLGLGIGADDYITKPFSVAEVVARVNAVLRRVRAASAFDPSKKVVLGELTINPGRHTALLDGDQLTLKATEFRLLAFLAAHPGWVFTREQLMEYALGDEELMYGRNIDVHIWSLRKKLGENRNVIETIWGVGYRLLEPEEWDE